MFTLFQFFYMIVCLIGTRLLFNYEFINSIALILVCFITSAVDWKPSTSQISLFWLLLLLLCRLWVEIEAHKWCDLELNLSKNCNKGNLVLICRYKLVSKKRSFCIIYYWLRGTYRWELYLVEFDCLCGSFAQI